MKRRKRYRKQYIRKGIAGLLAAVLAMGLAGCGGAENSAGSAGESGNADTQKESPGNSDTSVTAKGRYIETQLEGPQGFQGDGEMTLLSDGSIMLLDWENAVKSISKDKGMTWTSEAVEEIEEIYAGVSQIQMGGTIGTDGSIFICYTNWAESTEDKLFPEKYLYLAADGTKQEFELGLDNYEDSVERAVFSEDGRLFAMTNGGGKIYEIDLQNQSAKELFTLDRRKDMAMCGGNERIAALDGYSVSFYDLNSGEITAEDRVLNDFVAEQCDKKEGMAMCFGTGEEGQDALYLASVGGIYRHVIGGSVMEQLADGELNNLGDPTRTPVSMVQPEEGSFLILYQDGELYSYVYDAEASAVPEEQITLYSLYDNETVRRAVSVFRQQYPDVFVKFEIGLSDENGMTEEDAVRSLNTRILAGEGPDLLLLTGMPVDSYVEKGILADLSEQVETWKQETSFFDGILEGCRQESGLYALPVRYEIPLIGGEGEVISSIADLKTLADAAEQLADSGQVKVTVLNTYTAEELLERLYAICAGAWVTEDNTVDEQALTEFLTEAKRIYAAEQKNLTAEDRESHDEIISALLGFYSEAEMKKAMMEIGENTGYQLQGSAALVAGYLSSMDGYRTFVSEKEKLEELGRISDYRFKAWNGQNAQVFVPTGMVGLCTNAKNPEYAERFIETLLSEEVQREDLGDGFPVNQDAFEDFVTNPNPELFYSLGMESMDGEIIELNFHWPTETELAELKQLISSLNTPAETSSLIKDSVISIGEQALTGEKEIDESVEEIVQKLSLQLQE